MFRIVLSGATAMAFTVTGTAPSFAGNDCYQSSVTAPIYGSVTESIMVNPEYIHVQVSPPITGTVTYGQPVRTGYGFREVAPEVWHHDMQRVKVEPARTVRHRIAEAVTETRYRTVRVGGGYRWEWRMIDGRRVLCKIKVKARTERVAYRHQIKPAKYSQERLPARYEKRLIKTLVKPARMERYAVATQYEAVTEPVVLVPKQVRKTYVGASYYTATRRVLVAPGSEDWKRVKAGRCK